jgi:hypothetical protein
MITCLKHMYGFPDNETCPECRNELFGRRAGGGGPTTGVNPHPQNMCGGGQERVYEQINPGNGYLGQDKTFPQQPLRLDMSMRPSKEDLDKAERKRRRNDLAKEAMKLLISQASFKLYATRHKEVAASSYAYADAMLAASGDYDDLR